MILDKVSLVCYILASRSYVRNYFEEKRYGKEEEKVGDLAERQGWDDRRFEYELVLRPEGPVVYTVRGLQLTAEVVYGMYNHEGFCEYCLEVQVSFQEVVLISHDFRFEEEASEAAGRPVSSEAATNRQIEQAVEAAAQKLENLFAVFRQQKSQ